MSPLGRARRWSVRKDASLFFAMATDGQPASVMGTSRFRGGAGGSGLVHREGPVGGWLSRTLPGLAPRAIVFALANAAPG